MCGFGDGIWYAMIHMDGVLGLPGLLVNIIHGVILDVFYGKSSILWNEVPGVSVGVIYNHYLDPVSIHHDFLSLSKIFLLKIFIYLISLSNVSRIVSVTKLKSLIWFTDVWSMKVMALVWSGVIANGGGLTVVAVPPCPCPGGVGTVNPTDPASRPVPVVMIVLEQDPSILLIKLRNNSFRRAPFVIFYFSISRDIFLAHLNDVYLYK